MRKLILNICLILALTFVGCRSQKPVSEFTKTDTITLVKERPVKIEIKPDTATFRTAMDSLYFKFKDAANGTVIAHKKGKDHTSVLIKKGVKGELIVEGTSTGKDTTVITTDKTTAITNSTERTYQQKESWIERQCDAITRWVFWLFVLLIGLFVLRKFSQ